MKDKEKNKYKSIKDKKKLFHWKNGLLEWNEWITYKQIDLEDFFYYVFVRDEEEGLPFEKKGKENYIQGRYNAICINIKKNIRVNWIITDDLQQLKEIKGQDFVISSPITYIGKNRTAKNARYCYGFAFDLDGVGENEMRDVIYRQHTKRIPLANIIVNSGNGVHLYYLFEKPIALFDNIKILLNKMKKFLTDYIWDGYTSYLEEKQVQGIFQGFRLPDTKTKFGETVSAWVNEKAEYHTIDDLNKYLKSRQVGKRFLTYLSEDEVDTINNAKYKTNRVSKEKAKELYPDWYERRIIKGEPRRKWNIKPDLYYWWLDKLKNKNGKEGHRYFCIMTLAMYAIKCNISYEELEKDAYSLLDTLEAETMNEDNHFTSYDIEEALKAYRENYTTFPRKDIEKITAIPITANKRNGRKQKEHIHLMNMMRDNFTHKDKNWRENNGRKSKLEIVQKWKLENPNGTKYACQKATKLSKNTIKKWWDFN